MSSFRLPSDVVASWKASLSDHRSVKGVDEILKEVLSVLKNEDAEGHVVVTRHQLFNWSESLRGAATRAANSPIQAVSDDMKSYLGEAKPARAPAPAVETVAAVAIAPSFAPRSTYEAPAPVMYTRPAVSATPVASGSSRLLAERDFPSEVTRLLREARSEILICSPWTTGIDSLSKELLNIPPGVTVRVLSRRPMQEDPEYFRVLQEMRKKAFDVVLSPSIHTRMVVQDLSKMVFGAASNPGAGVPSKEMALLTTDAATVGAARAEFLRMMEEARGR